MIPLQFFYERMKNSVDTESREPMAYDNRLKKIAVTDKALLYKQQVIEDLTALEETFVKGISEADLQVFFNVIEKMMDNLSE